MKMTVTYISFRGRKKIPEWRSCYPGLQAGHADTQSDVVRRYSEERHSVRLLASLIKKSIVSWSVNSKTLGHSEHCMLFCFALHKKTNIGYSLSLSLNIAALSFCLSSLSLSIAFFRSLFGSIQDEVNCSWVLCPTATINSRSYLAYTRRHTTETNFRTHLEIWGRPNML